MYLPPTPSPSPTAQHPAHLGGTAGSVIGVIVVAVAVVWILRHIRSPRR